MVNASFVWGVAFDPDNFATDYLVQTQDGGKTLTVANRLPDRLSITTGETKRIIFDLIDPKAGWAIDSAGKLEFTTDSGKTWTPLNAHITPTF